MAIRAPDGANKKLEFYEMFGPEEVFSVVEVFVGAGISVETASVEEEHSRGQPVKRLHMYRKQKTLKRRISRVHFILNKFRQKSFSS